MQACRKLRVLPLRQVLSQLESAFISFRDLTLTPRDIQAACWSIRHNTSVLSLDFTGNFIKGREFRHIKDLLATLENLCHLVGRRLGKCNKLDDKDALPLAALIKTNRVLTVLLLRHNEFREDGGLILGEAIGINSSLEVLDLGWNHIRRRGAIGIAQGLEKNTSLRVVNLEWNGFGFEGCVALGDTLACNCTMTELNLACNRIHPPALLELLRGLAVNKTLRILKLGHNPITAGFSSLILAVVKRQPESALENIDLENVVVDKEFVSLLRQIQLERFFIVTYDLSLPVRKLTLDEMREKVGLPSAYNVDPLKMLYLLKEKMRASDFFYKINKDHDKGLQRNELYALFDEAGLPVTGSVIDKIMEFMDTNDDGIIDLKEFLLGDKRIKSISRKLIREDVEKKDYSKYSRTFQRAHIDPITNALKIDPNTSPMRQSRRLSVEKSKREADDKLVQISI
ncbi:leucine-rich repeat-containing protein 74B-like [Physella acuta]|uniref:leucine-rich repeat-containing protein 74B-like n=1 Tax=Physella acuta TaxID=109671 RepID=UPI0027DC452D|nr:leucine-rich repeat-containing protein 74B-like [Physella acuta]